MYLVSLPIKLADLTRGLLQQHASRLALHQELDEGYLVHCALSELFGPRSSDPNASPAGMCPALFSVRTDADPPYSHKIWAYSQYDTDALYAQAERIAPPETFAACHWDRFVQKTMPTLWQSETKFAYSVRVCPTVRYHDEEKSRQKEKKSTVFEADAFMRACTLATEAGQDLPIRAQVYADWLRKRMGDAAFLPPASVRMTGFQVAQFVRQGQSKDFSRKMRSIAYPVAQLEGELIIKDNQAFAHLLETGIGRHTAFGFGMLLLRAAV